MSKMKMDRWGRALLAGPILYTMLVVLVFVMMEGVVIDPGAEAVSERDGKYVVINRGSAVTLRELTPSEAALYQKLHQFSLVLLLSGLPVWGGAISAIIWRNLRPTGKDDHLR